MTIVEMKTSKEILFEEEQQQRLTEIEDRHMVFVQEQDKVIEQVQDKVVEQVHIEFVDHMDYYMANLIVFVVY
jgi:hypothetical protein